jgi:putative ABC transport system permease protein
MLKPGALALLIRLTLRHWAGDPWRLAATLLGVALGMALVVSIRLSSQAALSSFESSLDLLTGRADLSLTQNGESFSEQVLQQLGPSRTWGEMVPLVKDKMAAVSAPQDLITVLGTDLLNDGKVRDGRLLGEGGKPLGFQELLELLPQSDVVFLTQKYADSHGFKAGESEDFLIQDHWQRLKIGGLLADQGLGRALDGQVAVMDIAVAQKVFGKIGKLDEIEWVANSPKDRDRLQAWLQGQVPPSFEVERPSSRNIQVEKMLRAFQANLLALALVSLLVGAFLVYNSMSIAVLRRLQEIGALRTLGMSRSEILQLVLLEAAGLGVLGALAGMVLGWGMTRAALGLIGGTMKNLYLDAPLENRIPLSTDAWLWVLFGVALILLAALPPALQASKIPPSLSIRKGYAESAFEAKVAPLALWGFLAWAGAAPLSRLPAFFGLPLGGYAAAFLLLAGAALMTPALLKFFCARSEKIVGGWFPAEGRLALRNLTSGLGRSSVAVAALVMGVGLMVSVAVMVGSFRSTVILWLDQTLKADLYLRPASDQSGKLDSLLSPETVQAVAASSGVLAVERLRGIQMNWKGENLYIASFDVNVLRKYGNLVFKTHGKPSDFLDQIQKTPSVIISEPLQLKENIQAGDLLTLQTPSGPVSLPVAAVYYDYSNDRGTVILDRPLFTRLFKDDGVNGLAVYLKPGLDADAARGLVLKNLPLGTQLFIRSNAALKKEVLRIFDQTFAITYAMEAIALLVAVLGIVTTLTALILERGPEIAVLRYVCATRGQIQRTLFWEAGWMGLVGNLLGLGVGLLLALLLINVINVQSFGWTIQWRAPWFFLAEALGLVLAATLAAGVYPALLASRLPTMKEVNPE